MRSAWLLYCVLLSAFFVPALAGAHEVYVLSNEVIAHDVAVESPNPLDAFFDHKAQFMVWAFIAVVLVSTVFFASITHKLEEFFHRFLYPLRAHARTVARLTLGVCLIAGAWYGALFGPELPLAVFGPLQTVLIVVLALCGVLIVFDRLTLYATLLALGVFALSLWQWGFYPLITYANYLGEILLLLIVACGGRSYEALGFLLLRVLFGASLIGASVYAKFVHAQLALDVVARYHLTNYFHFDPLFIVLGAGIIEFLAGVFIIIGFEIRHTALFLLFWLTLSLFYFQEAVWPHLVLVGVLISLFMYGYDKYSIEGRFFTRGNLQPFL